jgi:hypothetical protein
MYSNGKWLLYCPRALWPGLFLLSILPANAEERTASGTAQEYVQCLQTDQTAVDSAATARFVTRKGLTPSSFSLWSAADGAPIAQVLVERPGDERFEKVSASMQTLVEEVAKLRHVPTARQELADGINIISVNPNAPDAHFAGISMLADPRRNEIVQWYWQPARSNPARDLATLQTTVWRQLSACISQRGIVEKEDLAANHPGTVPPQLREHADVEPAAERD